MIESVLVVLSRPVSERHDEFNDWYTNIHLRDALRFRGAIAVQRFVACDAQPGPLAPGWHWDYLALYEVFDTVLFTQAHRDAADTVWMEITEAFDASDLNDFYYSPLIWRMKPGGGPRSGGVIMEQFNAAPGKDRELTGWYSNDRFDQAFQRPGVVAGAFLPLTSAGQMMPHPAGHNYIALYWTREDAAGAEEWSTDGLAQSDLIDRKSLCVSRWRKLTRRLTIDDVRNTSSADLAAEEQARSRLRRVSSGSSGRSALGL